MKKLVVVEPFYSSVYGYYDGYTEVEEFEYSPKNEYRLKQQIRRYNKRYDTNFSVVVTA